jgi:hypothetical protein
VAKSGKACGFHPHIRRFKSCRPLQFYDSLKCRGLLQVFTRARSSISGEHQVCTLGVAGSMPVASTSSHLVSDQVQVRVLGNWLPPRFGSVFLGVRIPLP